MSDFHNPQYLALEAALRHERDYLTKAIALEQDDNARRLVEAAGQRMADEAEAWLRTVTRGQ